MKKLKSSRLNWRKWVRARGQLFLLDLAQTLHVGLGPGEGPLDLGAGHLQNGDEAVELAHQAVAVLGGVEVRLAERFLRGVGHGSILLGEGGIGEDDD